MPKVVLQFGAEKLSSAMDAVRAAVQSRPYWIEVRSGGGEPAPSRDSLESLEGKLADGSFTSATVSLWNWTDVQRIRVDSPRAGLPCWCGTIDFEKAEYEDLFDAILATPELLFLVASRRTIELREEHLTGKTFPFDHASLLMAAFRLGPPESGLWIKRKAAVKAARR